MKYLKDSLRDLLSWTGAKVSELEREDLPAQVRAQLVRILHEKVTLQNEDFERPWADFVMATGFDDPEPFNRPKMGILETKEFAGSKFKRVIGTQDIVTVLDALGFFLFYVTDRYRIPPPDGKTSEAFWKSAYSPEATPLDGFQVMPDPHRAQTYRWVVGAVNDAFRRAGVKYQFNGRQFFRTDSEFAWTEITEPVLALLSDPRFETVNREYRLAHEHRRHSREGWEEDCVVACGRAFESTMKIICKERDAEHDASNLPAGDLVRRLKTIGFLPDYLGRQFDNLYGLLGSGVSQVRNNEGGHGDGDKARRVRAVKAAYALHLTAVNITFLVEMHRANPKE